MELVIKGQLSSSRDGLGGEESNSQLAVDRPLERDTNVKSVILGSRYLQRVAVTLFPVYLLCLTVGFAAVVHKAGAVALERCVNDLRGHGKELREFCKHRFLWTVSDLIATNLVVLEGHEVVVYVFVASVFFHSHLEFLVVQHFPAVFQHKIVSERKTKAFYTATELTLARITRDVSNYVHYVDTSP